MTGHIRFPAQGFGEEVRGKLDLAPGEAASYTWQFDANRFLEPTMKVFALGETTDFVIDVDSITMADGTTVSRATEQ